MDKILLHYGDVEYIIDVVYKNVKNITLKVHANKKVEVIANPSISYDFLEDYVSSKKHWIYKKIRSLKEVELETNNLRFVSGEAFRYLGRQYRIKIEESNNEKVAFSRNYITIRVSNMSNFTRKQNLFNYWLMKRSNAIFIEILERSMLKFSNHNLENPELKIRKMKNRWGSFTNNTIILNSMLIHKKKIDIEYVIIHELIHKIHQNHSSEFYNLLSLTLPDWKIRKKHLDNA